MTGTVEVPRRRVSARTTLALGLVTGLIGLAGNVVASFVTKWSGGLSWFAVPVVAVGMAVVAAFTTSYVEVPSRESAGSPTPPRAGLSFPAALFTIVLLLGVGGFAATWGIRYVTGYISGNEPGIDRLVEPMTGSAQNLTLRVTEFEETRHFTRLTVNVRNDLRNTVMLPVFKNCLVIGGNGATLEADPFRSDWSETVAAGGSQSGTITFPGHLPPGVRRARLAFGTVGEQGFDGPRTIQVSGLHLKPKA